MTAKRNPARPKPTFDHLISAKQPITTRDWFGCPDELLDEFADARRTYDSAQLLHADNEELLRAAKQRLDAARAAVRDNSVEVVMRSIGRSRWESLKIAHPPTEEQKAEAKKENPNAELTFNIDTFPSAAIAASTIQPGMTVEQVQQIWDSEDWNEAECARLLQMALYVNERRKTADLAF